MYGLFCVVYAASRDRYLVSHVSNHLAVEVIIMHETKGFSRAIRDKLLIEQENNQIHFSRKFLVSHGLLANHSQPALQCIFILVSCIVLLLASTAFLPRWKNKIM